MNPTVTLALITAIALSTCGIMVVMFFVSDLAYAAYSYCTTVDNRLVCNTSPDQICTFYGPNSVVCDSRNSQNMTIISDIPNIDTDD
jgi:hypothetical protein